MSNKQLNTYGYRQNNSGGFYDIPYSYVLIEAESASEANAIAQRDGIGVYFDPDCVHDCECCGPRWERQTDGFGDKAKACPGGVDTWLEVNAPHKPKRKVLLYKADGTIVKATFGQLSPENCW